MAEKYGWTLKYIESLPISRIHEHILIQDGKNKALEELGRKRK
jgi:hypothetical protein